MCSQMLSQNLLARRLVDSSRYGPSKHLFSSVAKKKFTTSYDKGPTDTPLINDPIGVVLRKTTSKFGDRPALVSRHQGIRWNYEQFSKQVTSLAKGLLALGLKKGDRVGIWSENSAEWLLAQYATAQMGMILVNVNPVYKPHELQYTLNKVTCKALIFSEVYKKTDFLSSILHLFPELGSYPHNPPNELQLAAVPSLKHLIKVRGPSTNLPGIHNLEEVMDADQNDQASSLHKLFDDTFGTVSVDDPINIQFTSGTTGSPKGATLTHKNILNNGFFVGETQRITEKDRICIPVPLFHCFGMVMGSLAATTHGSLMVLPAGSFEAEATLLSCVEEQCTALYGVPTMFIAMLSNHRFPELQPRLKETLRTGIMAGSTCPEAIMRRAIDEMGVSDITVCYGMTETSPVSLQTHVDDPLIKRVATLGRCGPHIETRIVDADGNVVPVGVKGEITTRGYSVMKGYWSGDAVDIETTRKAGLGEDGWMHTGDLGVMDEDGFVSIVGRLKDMVIRGGENVYPREIEEQLYLHPLISDAQVIGVPDEFMGEEVAVWIKVDQKAMEEHKKLGKTFTEKDVHDFLAEELANFKIPRYVLFVDDFPLTPSGKVQKYLMREATTKMIKDNALPPTADYRKHFLSLKKAKV